MDERKVQDSESTNSTCRCIAKGDLNHWISVISKAIFINVVNYSAFHSETKNRDTKNSALQKICRHLAVNKILAAVEFCEKIRNSVYLLLSPRAMWPSLCGSPYVYRECSLFFFTISFCVVETTFPPPNAGALSPTRHL